VLPFRISRESAELGEAALVVRKHSHDLPIGVADKFLFEPYRRLFCSGKCTFVPEHTTQAQKIVTCNFPVLEFGIETGRLINCLLKVAFMRASLLRDVTKHPVPAFLFQDEGQLFLLGGSGGGSRDNAFAQVARASRICTVFITQNILNIAEALGEHYPGARTKALLGNFGIKIFHQQNETETRQYAADLIGKDSRYMKNISVNPMEPGITHGEHLMYKLDPDEFAMLMKPDSINPFAAAVVYQGSTPLPASRASSAPRRRFVVASSSAPPTGRLYGQVIAFAWSRSWRQLSSNSCTPAELHD